MASLPPSIGKYQVIDRLGEGGMGTLYLARDPLLDRLVAIKVLRGDFDDPELRERFSREARTVSNLIHDNIVIIYEYGDFEGQPFIAMQYVAGESLAEIIRRRAYLTLERKLQMIDELCAGMAFAHRAKIVHRDLKPANIMVDADRGQIKILDFGIARNVEANATLYTQVIGTPSYMSPEQAGGLRVDYRSDIFAIGVVAYELLSYRKAFDGDSAIAIQHKILSEDPAPLPQVCPGIDQGIVSIVQKALAKEPAARYQDLKSMRADLARAVERSSRSNEGATIVVSPPQSSHAASTPSPSPRLEERRARQIQIHLDAASAALREEHYDLAIESCEHILLLDAHHDTALALLEKARAGADRVLVERHLTQARAHLRSGALTQADQELFAAAKIAGTDPAVRALQREVLQARRELERAMERAAASEAALARARASLEDGAYESALRAASEALAHTPDSTEARSLRARASEAIDARARERELERLATKAVTDAQARFDQGQHGAAIAALESFSPAHPIVAAALAVLRDKRAAIEEHRRREEEQRRVDEERRRAEDERRRVEEARRRERLERASAWCAQGRDRLATGDYDGALQAIAEAERLEPDLSGLANLRSDVLARKADAEAAAERQRRISSHLAEAERLLAVGELETALSEADAALAVDARDTRVLQVAERIRRAIADRRREAEEQEARAREALRLKRQAEAAAERQRKIASHVTEADRLLAVRELDAALAEVNAALSLDADDARALQVGASVRRAIEDRRRETEEREAQAREALRLKQEEEERRKRASALVASGDQRLAAGDYEGALAAAAEAERLAPSVPEMTRLQARAQTARDAAEAAARERARINQEITDRVSDAERCLDRQELDEALQQASAALALAPDERKIQRLRSTIQRAIDERAKAEAAQRQAALDAERRAKAEAERQRQEAFKREALEKERLDRAARLAELLSAASRQLESGEFEVTLRTVAEAERLDAKSADLKTLRSQALAQRAAAEALANRQRQAAAKVTSAERLLHDKNLENALRDVEAAIALDPDALSAKELRVRILRAMDDRRREEDTSRAAKIDATLASTRPLDEHRAYEATQVRQDQPTQVVTARPRIDAVPSTVKRSERSPFLMGAIAIVLLIVGTIAIWRWRSAPQPPPPAATTAQTPATGPPPPANSPSPADPLASHLQRLAALDPQRQADSVLVILVDALRIKSDDERFLGRLNDMFNDAQASAEREKNNADASNANALARDTYGRAETARQAGRRRGSPDQTANAIRRSWEARDLFARAADEARGAERVAADKAAADKAAAERAAAEETAAEKAAAQRAAVEKAAAERAAAEKAAAERAAAEKAVAERAAAEKAAADRAAEARRLATRQRDETDVRNVLEQYRSAYNNRDAAALSRVVSRALAQVDFREYRSYSMTISDIDVRIDGDSAIVRCTRQIDARSMRGNTRLPSQSQSITMTMRRYGISWIIESVDVN